MMVDFASQKKLTYVKLKHPPAIGIIGQAAFMMIQNKLGRFIRFYQVLTGSTWFQIENRIRGSTLSVVPPRTPF